MVRNEGYHFNEKAELKNNAEENGNYSFTLNIMDVTIEGFICEYNKLWSKIKKDFKSTCTSINKRFLMFYL